MRIKSIIARALISLAVFVCLGFFSVEAQTSVYYVDPTNGNDANNGTSATACGTNCGAWKTIPHADSTITLTPNITCTTSYAVITNAGACIYLLSGTYGSVTTTKTGSATSRVVYIAQTKWGPKFVGAAWTLNGSYSEVDGIDMTGPSAKFAFLLQSGSHRSIQYNYIHDFNTVNCVASTATTGDKNGVIHETTAPSSGDIINKNILRHFGGPGCAGGAAFHGIYGDGSGLQITNNIISGGEGGWAIQKQYAGTTDCTPGIISNNIIFNNAGGIVLNDEGSACKVDFWTIKNNIIVNNGIAGTGGGGGSSFGIDYYNFSATNTLVSNNIIYGNLPANLGNHGNACTGGNPGCPSTNTKTDASGVTATFTNFQADTNNSPASSFNATNYIPKSTSVAALGGTVSCAAAPGLTPCTPTTDILGNTITAPPSIGAFNAGASTFVGTLEDASDVGGGACTGPCWQWIHDAGTPGTSTGTSVLVASPSTTGQSRQFNFSWTALGGERASIYQGLGKLDTTSTNFVYDTLVQFNDLTHVTNLEFDHNQVTSDGNTVIYGAQCNMVVGVWQYTTNVAGSAHWNNSNIVCTRSQWTLNVFHHLTVAYHRNSSGIVTYDSVTFDGVTTPFVGASGNSSFGLGWTPIGALVENFQIDGDNTANSVVAYLDNFTVTGSVAAPITFIQSNSTTSASATTITVPYVTSQLSGDLNIVAIGWNDTTSNAASVTDSQGNAYTLAIGPTRGTGLSQAIYYAKNTVGGANTVTVTFNQPAVNVDVRVYEYIGLDVSNPFDVAVGASGTGLLADSGALTTRVATELVFGAGMTSNHFTGAGTGYISRGITTFGDIGEDKVVTTTGTYNSTAPNTSSGSWLFQTATFVVSGGVIPPPPPPPGCFPGTWTEANQPPTTCVPYPTSLFAKPLPGAGSGGPMTHLATNSDTIAQATMQPGHVVNVAGPGDADTQGNAYYYGKASDPIYKVTACTNQSAAPYNPINTFWHIPNGAWYSGGQSDEFFTVWDQTNNMMLSLYTSHNAYPTTLPNCTATTQATACSMSFPVNYCNMANRITDNSYQAGNGAGDSLGNAPGALIIRQNEWMTNTINHALYLNGGCEASTTVFPAKGHAATCTVQTNAPPHGSLYFFDYTSAQIAAMSIPAWQKAIITAMTIYGGYFGDTGSTTLTSDTHPSRQEGGEAYVQAGLTPPLYPWLLGQGLSSHTDGSSTVYSLDYWAGIPNVVGPNCPTSTCNFASHVHIADQCVPLGMAGQPGGCVGVTNSPPVMSSVSPSSGIVTGGNTVAIGGTGFLAGAIVRFGGTSATNIIVSSSTAITVTAPAGTLGLTSISVTNTDNQSSTLTNSYTYTSIPIPVSVTSITPPAGDVTGGTAVTIGGTGFLSGATVTAGTAATSVVVVNSSTITAVVPAHTAGAVNIVVTNTNGTNGTLTNGYTYTTSGGGGCTINCGGNITLQPSSPFNFGGSNVGAITNPQTFTLTNTTPGNINPINITFGGANPTDFSKLNDNCAGTNIPSTGTCTFQATFSAGAVGLRSATITISGPGFTTLTAVLQGTGIFVATGSVVSAPTSLSFGNITVLVPAIPIQTVTITNNTNGNVTVGTIITSSGDYTLTNNTCNGQVLAPTIGCTFQVTFTPSVAGSRPGTLTIPGTGFSSLVLTLDGTGIDLPLPPSALIAIVN